MIERKYYLHAPGLDFFNGWTSAILISLAGHGVLISSILMFVDDISKPIPPQAFNVEVIIEKPPKKQDNAIKTKVKNIKIAPSQVPTSSDGISRQPPKQLAVREIKKTISVLPHTAEKNLTARPIYAPAPKYKPKFRRLASEKILDSQSISKSLKTKIIEKNKTGSSLALSETILRDVTPKFLSSFGGKATVAKVAAKATIPTLPPKIDPKGENLWPRYPRRARQRGIEGELLLRVTVNAKGRSSGIKVLESSGHDVLDRAAVEALKNWRFQPGRRGTKPVKASMDMPVVFRLQ